MLANVLLRENLDGAINGKGCIAHCSDLGVGGNNIQPDVYVWENWWTKLCPRNSLKISYDFGLDASATIGLGIFITHGPRDPNRCWHECDANSPHSQKALQIKESKVSLVTQFRCQEVTSNYEPLKAFFLTPHFRCACSNHTIRIHPLPRWKTTWSSWGLGPGARCPNRKSDQSTRWALASRKKVNGAGLSPSPSWLIKESYHSPTLCIWGKSFLRASLRARSWSRRASSISQDWMGQPGSLAIWKASLADASKEAGHTSKGSWQSSLLAMVPFTRQKISFTSAPLPRARGIRPRNCWTCSGIPARETNKLCI